MGSDFDLKPYGQKPDIMCIGKALSGGLLPVSGIVADDYVMSTLQDNDHGSTFAGNPLGMAVAKTALQIIIEEDLTRNASIVGSYMKKKFTDIKSPMIWDTRGRGLM